MIDCVNSSFNSFENSLKQNNQNQNTSSLFSQFSQNHSTQQPSHKIFIYVRTKTKKSVKLLIDPIIQLALLHDLIAQKLKIQTNSQILYLKGKNIQQQKSIKLQQKQIIHVISKEDFATQSQKIYVNVKVLYEKQAILQNFCYQFTARDTGRMLLQKIQKDIRKPYGISQQYGINILYASKLVAPALTFEQNGMCKSNEVICLFSLNQMKTICNQQNSKSNQQHKNLEQLSSKNEEENKQIQRITDEKEVANIDQNNETNNRIRENIKVKSNAYLQQKDKNEQLAPRLRKKSQTLYMTPSTPNFKKKKYFDEDNMTDQSTLLKRIKVSKSKKEIEQIIELSLSKKKLQFDEQNESKSNNEAKSQVSSSSSQQQNQQQKQKQKFTLYKPSPLIPKSMPTQQRNLIRQQIQKLFSSDINLQSQKKQPLIEKSLSKSSGFNQSKEIIFGQNNTKQSKQFQFKSYGGLQLNFTPKVERNIMNKNLRSTLGSNFDLSKLRVKKNRYEEDNKDQE